MSQYIINHYVNSNFLDNAIIMLYMSLGHIQHDKTHSLKEKGPI